MINEKELEISNKSYINKDFQKLYPDILDLARKLSAKWDPTTSNESDPGVVLLKMLGFTGDMLNYNSDKNALEAFMPSATQENSMRNLCEMNGYFPKYYQSATVTVSMMYTGSKLTDPTMSFKLGALETTLTDVDGTITYTLLDDAVFNERYKTVTASAIEGKLETLTINNVEEIHLSNLDDNNRIYFPEKQVAENGVFVRSLSDTAYFWNRVDNLNTIEPGQFVYKFGYDSVRALPYLEFPQDISFLIEDGLSIQYIRTAGSRGNIRSGFLSVLSSPAEISVTGNASVVVYPDTNDNESEKSVLLINNVAEAINGRDPETIDEAYNSFKKVVGTFDTLVTSRDYANAIYNLKTSDNKDVVSNVQVADRRTDINYSNNILSFNEYGIEKINITDSDIITPFDLCLYPLNPIITSYTKTTYDNSFLPLNDLTDVKAGIEDYKTISHDYKDLVAEDIYLFKNYYTLNAKITTNYKVNKFEQDSILSNINDALYRNFNSRELDYGYEIPFDRLLETIEGADTRIKNVSLDEPNLSTKVMTENRAETPLLDGNKTAYLSLMTKNILAGRASLFNYNEDFDFDFGQTAVTISDESPDTGSDFIHEKIVSLTTEVKVTNAELKAGYTLKDNEYIQAIAPSLVTEITYPAYVNYRWEGADIAENEEHTITGTEALIINYIDSNDVSIAIKYTANSIITYKVDKNKKPGEDYYGATKVSEVAVDTTKPNIFKPVGLTLQTPADYNISGIVTTKKIEFGASGDGLAFYSFGTEESVEKRKFVETTLTSRSLPCYWIMNNKDNALFSGTYTGTGYETVLGENEYFIYSNSSLTELEVLGSGTRLTLTCLSTEDLDSWKLNLAENEEQVQITEVSEMGLAAFDGYNWRYKNFDADYNLNLAEMTVLTLSSGDTIKISGSTTFDEDIRNDWVDIPSGWEISYTIEGTTKTLPTYNDSIMWKVRSRLDLNSGPDLKQKLLQGQSITLKLYVSGSVKGGDLLTKTRIYNTPNTYIMFNTLIQQAGGEDLDMEVTYLDGSKAYAVNAFTFNYTKPTYEENTTGGTKETPFERGPSGYAQINCKNLTVAAGTDSADIVLPMTSYYNVGSRISGSGKTQLLMIHWSHSDNITNVSLSVEAGGIRFYNQPVALAASLTLVEGINIIEINSVGQLTITVENPDAGTDVLLVGKVSVTSGYNSALNLDNGDIEGVGTGLLALIAAADPRHKFFYNGTLDSHSLIEYNDLSDPRAFFDYNNLANRFTLCQIDFENSKIEIVRTSKV